MSTSSGWWRKARPTSTTFRRPRNRHLHPVRDDNPDLFVRHGPVNAHGYVVVTRQSDLDRIEQRPGRVRLLRRRERVDDNRDALRDRAPRPEQRSIPVGAIEGGIFLMNLLGSRAFPVGLGKQRPYLAR